MEEVSPAKTAASTHELRLLATIIEARRLRASERSELTTLRRHVEALSAAVAALEFHFGNGDTRVLKERWNLRVVTVALDFLVGLRAATSSSPPGEWTCSSSFEAKTMRALYEVTAAKDAYIEVALGEIPTLSLDALKRALPIEAYLELDDLVTRAGKEREPSATPLDSTG